MPTQALGDFAPITTSMTGDQYMSVLAERQRIYEQAHAKPGPRMRFPALLEWFIQPGEEHLVLLPEPAPAERPAREPRTYRSAESLRQERERVAAEMTRVAGIGDLPDRAAANLSPHSRSRAARNAGRRRFAVMDRALETYARLNRRLAVLNGQIARAEARESSEVVTPEGTP